MDEPIAWRVAAKNPLSRMKVRERRRGKHDPCDNRPPPTGEMWFSVTDQPTFAVAGFWQAKAEGNGFSMVTYDPNALVAPIHLKAMITFLVSDDCNTWLQAKYDEITVLQISYDASCMSASDPLFLPTNKDDES